MAKWELVLTYFKLKKNRCLLNVLGNTKNDFILIQGFIKKCQMSYNFNLELKFPRQQYQAKITQKKCKICDWSECS